MRKDSISEKAIEQAYLIYSERGHQVLDYSHTPTDYARGTVMEPENTSVINSRFGEILPENVRGDGEYDSLAEQEKSLDLRIDSLQGEMQTSRMRGNFKGLQAQMKQMHDLIKAKEALDAKLSTLDLGRKQMDDYNRTMNQEDSYSEHIQSVGSRIAELEAKLHEFRESAK